MKHIKLFEQIEDWDDPFGEDFADPEELKVGDKVRILNNDGMAHLVIGSIGTIVKIKYGLEAYYEVHGEQENPKYHCTWCYSARQLEKVGEINEEYRYVKFDYRKGWDASRYIQLKNKKDKKEPFLNKNKIDYKNEKNLKEYLNKYFAPYLTYDKYLKYKEELEESGYEININFDYFYAYFDKSLGYRIWKIDPNTSIFIKYGTEDDYEDEIETEIIGAFVNATKNRKHIFKTFELKNEEDFRKIIDYIKNLKNRNMKSDYEKHKDVDPYGEEDWVDKEDNEEIFEQYNWDEDPFWRRY